MKTCLIITTLLAHTCVRLSSVQVSVSERAADDMIIQPSITKLQRLAHLRVGGSVEAEVRQFPPGFGRLSALTALALCRVKYSDEYLGY